MSMPYLGEIRAVSFTVIPRGWASCAGQLMSIQQNQALFSLLGVQFGGNGIQTFGLPDLRSRTPISYGNSTLQGQIVMGELSGTEQVTMLQSNLPAHNHMISASSATATETAPAGNVWAPMIDGSGNSELAYTESAPNAIMSPAALASAGNNLPIPIMQPYTVINYIIALQGIFPSRG